MRWCLDSGRHLRASVPGRGCSTFLPRCPASTDPGRSARREHGCPPPPPPPGCGKSTVFEDLNLIFNTSGKPARDSSFPLSGILGTDVLLLQEFSWSAKICAFEELLQMLAGERLAVRVPCARPVQHRITASMFYTAWAPLGVTGMDASRPYNLNTAVAERFTTRTWARPHPP